MDTSTQTLHRLTSYAEFDEETVWEPPVADPRVVEFATNDVDRLPWFYKHYRDGLPTVPLLDQDAKVSPFPPYHLGTVAYQVPAGPAATQAVAAFLGPARR